MSVIRVRLAEPYPSNRMGDARTLKDKRTAGDTEGVEEFASIQQSTKWGNDTLTLTEKQAKELHEILAARFSGVA